MKAFVIVAVLLLAHCALLSQELTISLKDALERARKCGTQRRSGLIWEMGNMAKNGILRLDADQKYRRKGVSARRAALAANYDDSAGNNGGHDSAVIRGVMASMLLLLILPTLSQTIRLKPSCISDGG